MIKIQGAIPRHIGVAVSGGVDSMAVLHFLSQNHDVTAYCFDHGTEFGSKALKFVENYCEKNNISLLLLLVPIKFLPKLIPNTPFICGDFKFHKKKNYD